jgi:phage recombination protein Bet
MSTEITLSDERIQLIKDTFAKGATDSELRLFIATANRLGLDPFARQIYLVRRWDQALGREAAQAQVSIDGFRVVAEKTRQYRGQTAPAWCGQDGVWRDAWLSDAPPSAARIGVHREGFAEPLYRVARYQSYVQLTRDQKPTRMWRTMPDVMLAKCAEALALRAAFPNELSGIYTTDEMEQADIAQTETPARPDRTADPPALRLLPAENDPSDTPEGRMARELFLPQLQRLKTADELRGWWVEVAKADYQRNVKVALYRVFEAHAKRLGHKPALLVGAPVGADR